MAVTVQVHGSPSCYMCEYAMNQIVAAASTEGIDVKAALNSVCNQLDTPSEVRRYYVPSKYDTST